MQEALFLPPAQEPTMTVAELNRAIGLVLGRAFPDEVWVQGEIANLSRPPSGHVYFDLIGDGSSIGVTLWASDRQVVNAVLRRAGGAVRMTDGTEVRIRARISWWPERGRVSLRMLSIDTAYTLGRLAEARELLLQQLTREGVVDRQKALPLPLVPLRVGLITSAGSAAAADFVHTLELSGRAFDVVLVDARVQGIDAESSLLAAFEAFATRQPLPDVVCVVRGGGARTDLAAFDREAVARAIAACPRPVLTGIGHEIDTTIADVVAHASHKTPTACATALVERVAAFCARLDERTGRLHRASHVALERASARLARTAERTRSASRAALATADARVEQAAVRAAALDPARVLARGWSITRTADGALVRAAGEVEPGTSLVTTVADGEVRSTADG